MNKVVIVGKDGCGKSNLVYRMKNGKATREDLFSPNMTFSFCEHASRKIPMWEIGDKWYKMLGMYLVSAVSICICFEDQDLEYADQIYTTVMKANDKTRIFLVATKADRKNSFNKMIEYARMKGCKIFITSAYTGEGVADLLNALVLEDERYESTLSSSYINSDDQKFHISKQCCFS